MRFNDKELVSLGLQQADLEGVLHHMKPQGTEWSDWYQQPSFKERYFKLKGNLLFYYRIGEPEPVGILVLETAQIAYEHPHKGIPFAFSLTFNNNDAKHIFSCRCDSDVNRWVAAMKAASYEYWRSQYIILSTKLAKKSGKEPVFNCITPASSYSIGKTKIKENKSTFYREMEESSFRYGTTNNNDQEDFIKF